MRVAAWVESLMGYGHALRMLNLLKVLAPEASCVLSGSIISNRLLEGRAADTEIVPLDYLSIDDLRRPYQPIGADGLSIAQVLAVRTEQAWRRLKDFQPTSFIIEHFPFGRYALEPEIVELIEKTRAEFPSCRIVCSIRDIPRATPLPPRYGKILRRILPKYFDEVVVHGDRRLFNIELIFPELRKLRQVPIVYAGYLKSGFTYEWDSEAPWIIDTGGGWGSRFLLDKIIEEAALNFPKREINVVAGNYLDKDIISGINRSYSKNINFIFDAEKGEMKKLKASLCIGRLGYNTGVEILASRVPFIAVPHKTSTEQNLRAFIFAELRRAEVIAEEDIINRPHVLSGGIEKAEELAAAWSLEAVEPFFSNRDSLINIFSR